MAGDLIGRSISMTIGGSVVAEGRTKSLTINNSAINVTGDGDDGIQKILDEAGEKSVDLSYDGLRLLSDTTLLDLSLSSTPTAEIIFTVGGSGTGYTLTGDFFMSSYGESVPYNEAVTFTASFSSQAAVVKAAIA